MSATDALLDQLADMIAARVVDRLRAGDRPDWVDQHRSPLGSRRHCALARRLQREGGGDASKVGRRWMIRRARIDRELGGQSEPTSPTAEQLAAELGVPLRLVKGRQR